jgi:hypothetical protein
MQLMKLYATILQLYATILQQFHMQLYATRKLYATMQLIMFFSDYMQLYATICNLCNYMQL